MQKEYYTNAGSDRSRDISEYLVSVIVPIYKVEEYLEECLISITEQTYHNLDIILVDDGSPDRCPEICNLWADRDERCRVIHKENGGLSDARNAGLDTAKGDYICFVDSDDWIRSDMIEIMLKAAVCNNADICACGIMDVYSTRRVERKTLFFKGGPEEILARLYNETQYPVSAWNKLYKRKCWESLRFPKGRICEDAFTTYLLIDQADCIIQIPEVLYYYRIRDNSIMTSPFSEKKMDEEEAWRCNYLFMQEHYPSVAGPAFDFYLKKVNRLIGTLTPENRKIYFREYTYLRKVLRDNLGYILFRSHMRLKQRVYLVRQYFLYYR